jgi:hypothetical protein
MLVLSNEIEETHAKIFNLFGIAKGYLQVWNKNDLQ